MPDIAAARHRSTNHRVGTIEMSEIAMRAWHMPDLVLGRYRAGMARTDGDMAEARNLRTLAFHTRHADRDPFDGQCAHILIREIESGTPVCCFRLLTLMDGAQVGASYSAQFYELSALGTYEGRMLEIGRFCLHPQWHDPDILRVAWAAMTAHVDANAIGMLFGCSSFAGTETARYLDAFAMLRARHLAPARWLPRVKAPEVFRFAARLRRMPDARRAMLRMPPLLRSYLAMGGWVSDHAVVDRQLGTLHVFTGLEVGAIPPGRKRLLRALASGN